MRLIKMPFRAFYPDKANPVITPTIMNMRFSKIRRPQLEIFNKADMRVTQLIYVGAIEWR